MHIAVIHIEWPEMITKLIRQELVVDIELRTLKLNIYDVTHFYLYIRVSTRS